MLKHKHFKEKVKDVAQINVTFILRGNLMWYPEQKQKAHNLTVEDNLRIIDVINKLNVPIEQINYVIKNGQKVNVNQKLTEGDQIELLPIIVGG
ncbi:MAG: hypothetical protein PWQ70_3083 [Clostridiales bacterium]|nr:hypothetical protein [Clostridiales bacterium]